MAPRGGGGGGGYFTKFSVARFSMRLNTNWTKSNLRFVKMRGQKDLGSIVKGVNCIENEGENLYKMLKTVK